MRHRCQGLIILVLAGQQQQLGHSKCDAVELRILLYVYSKTWDLKGDLLFMELSEDDQFRNGFVGLRIRV